jgi:hypothetical protein
MIRGQGDLTKLWSDRLIATLIAKAPEFHFGQEVLHGDLQGLDYDLGDMHTLNLNIKEDIEFQRGLIVKLNRGKFSVWKLCCIALFGPLKQILLDLNKFCRFAYSYNNPWGTNYLLGVRSDSIQINSQNLLTESIDPHYTETWKSSIFVFEFEFKLWRLDLLLP